MTRDDADTGGGGLNLTIDRRAEVPIGVQLAWALRARIDDGRLATGQRLPGLRDLAQALKINANTVRAVYQRLEHEGMIESQQGSGTYVTATAHERSAAGAIAASAAQEARRTGIDPREVAAALYVEPEHQPAPPKRAAEHRRVAAHPDRHPRAAARENRSQAPRARRGIACGGAAAAGHRPTVARGCWT